MDNICAFTAPGHVVLAWTDDEADPQYELSMACLKALEASVDACGRRLQVLSLIHILTIMDACLKAGVNYIDTANYEPEDTDDPEWRAIYEKRCKEEGFTAYFDYSWQWAYKERRCV